MSDPNVVTSVQRAFLANPTAVPTANGQTVVLFSTHPRKPGGSGTAVTSTFVRANGTQTVVVSPDAIETVEVSFFAHNQLSAANGLRAYETLDGGATWSETDMKGYISGVANQPSIGAAAQIQVPVLSAGQEWVEMFDIGRYRGWALEYVTGATPPTLWAYDAAILYGAQGEA